jgi:hypothetical protein
VRAEWLNGVLLVVYRMVIPSRSLENERLQALRGVVSDGIDPHGANAALVKQFARRTQNTFPRARPHRTLLFGVARRNQNRFRLAHNAQRAHAANCTTNAPTIRQVG